MLRILTNLLLLNRSDIEATAGLLLSGFTGTWVAQIAGDKIDLPSAGGPAMGCIWTEQNRDGLGGFSPDVDATGKLTVVYGKFRALTDQYDHESVPSLGNALKLNTAGKLTAGTTGDGNVNVAYCTKAPHSIEHLGTSHTVIEYVTV